MGTDMWLSPPERDPNALDRLSKKIIEQAQEIKKLKVENTKLKRQQSKEDQILLKLNKIGLKLGMSPHELGLEVKIKDS